MNRTTVAVELAAGHLEHFKANNEKSQGHLQVSVGVLERRPAVSVAFEDCERLTSM